jgi:LuxR family transcriptional regulator, positive regulator of biofilm formation
MFKEILRKHGLTHREAEVAMVISRGISNKDAAQKLFVTEKTVKFHLTNIYKKMKIKSRAQLVVWCAPYLSFVEKEVEPEIPSWQTRLTPGKIGNA